MNKHTKYIDQRPSRYKVIVKLLSSHAHTHTHDTIECSIWTTILVGT